MEEELEIIRYSSLDGMRMFFNTVDYRTFHFHEEWEILIVLKNPLLVRTASAERFLQEGEIVVFNPYTGHSMSKVDRSSTFLCLQVSPDLYPGFESLATLSLEDAFIDKYISPQISQALREELFALMQLLLERKERYQLKGTISAGKILDLILDAVPSRKLSRDEMDSIIYKGRRLTSFKRFVDNNYRHKIKLADFAKDEGCSVSYLSTFIRRELNMSFREYVNQVRFYASLKLISSQHLSLQEICDECGFSDYRYFSNVFKEQTGMSPLEYRRNPVHISDTSLSVHQSIHTLERFYSTPESLELLNRFKQEYRGRPAQVQSQARGHKHV